MTPSNKTMNILIIGGAGFIGHHIINELHNSDYAGSVFVLEPPYSDVSRLEGLPIRLLRGNLRDSAFIESLMDEHKIDIIIHLASTILPCSDFRDYENELEEIVIPTIWLVKCCAKLNVKFVFFSSGGTVYGDRTSLVPFRETDNRNPICYYGMSKKQIEDYILFEHSISKLDFLILRPSNAYGLGQRFNRKQGLIAVALHKLQCWDKMTIWGNGENVRDYIYVEDLAKITVKLLNTTNNNVINIGTGIGYSTNEVLSIIERVSGTALSVINEEKRDNDVKNMILDISLLKSMLQYDFISLETGIRKFYESIRSGEYN